MGRRHKVVAPSVRPTMTVAIQPPPATGSDPDLLSVLYGYYQALLELQQPQAPSSIFVIDTAANLLTQAPADAWRGKFAQVTDKAAIAHSVETSPGVWAWLRADGSAL